ncbi:unnamed protein product [Tuber aestivum]|uniref:Integrase core domain-containing protein n=1 Tax=Tuber aestivum TaxID=59557 RepID=A0A292Q174_9PEZI|nr:unnamed protein product [Tuber aestivum]
MWKISRQYKRTERIFQLKDQIEFFQLMVMISCHDLDLKFMVQLMHIQVSVNKQYLRLLRTTLHMPKVIRSDKGSETVLLAESHLSLRRANHPDLPFEKAYSYRKSTKNQRIEAWWNILTKGQTQAWKVYFAQLESDGYFNGGDLDKLCLQFLYMKIIRSHIHRFVEIHNSHPIRLQRKREHYLPTGQPFLLYYYPESGKDYKEKVNESLLAALEAEVSEFDLDEYLPISTLALYQGFLDEVIHVIERRTSIYVIVYQTILHLVMRYNYHYSQLALANGLLYTKVMRSKSIMDNYSTDYDSKYDFKHNT